MSQEELGQLAGLDRTYVGNVERGESNVAVLTLAQLAEALGTTLANLVARSGLK